MNQDSTSSIQPIFIREQVIKAIRKFFDEQKFHEVMTPVLNASVPLEPTLYPFSTQWQTSSTPQTLYLSTSPERGLKKMLAQGIGNCYAIGKSFRNLEATGPQHNPEFLMLEWYRQDADYHQIMTDVQKLFHSIQQFISVDAEVDFTQTWQTLSVEQLIEENLGVKLVEILTEEALSTYMKEKGYEVEDATWEQLFNQLILNEVEPNFPQQPFFLIDFPARISPLCAVRDDKPYLAERFEVFVGGKELGNGNTENMDVTKIRQHFETEAQQRSRHQQQPQPIDEEFLTALATMAEMKTSFAGIGMGVDRIAMLFANQATIQAVEPFCISP